MNSSKVSFSGVRSHQGLDYMGISLQAAQIYFIHKSEQTFTNYRHLLII